MTSGAVKGSDTDNTAHHSAKDPKLTAKAWWEKLQYQSQSLMWGQLFCYWAPEWMQTDPQTSFSGTFLSWPGPSSVRGYSVELLFPGVSVLPYFLFYFGSLLSSVCCTQFTALFSPVCLHTCSLVCLCCMASVLPLSLLYCVRSGSDVFVVLFYQDHFPVKQILYASSVSHSMHLLCSRSHESVQQICD